MSDLTQGYRSLVKTAISQETSRRTQKKEHILKCTNTHGMWDKQVDTYIRGHTNRSFTSYFYTAPLKEGGNAIYWSRQGGVRIKVQVTSTNVGYREWQGETNKTLLGLRRGQHNTRTSTQEEVTLSGGAQRGATVRGKDNIML